MSGGATRRRALEVALELGVMSDDGGVNGRLSDDQKVHVREMASVSPGLLLLAMVHCTPARPRRSATPLFWQAPAGAKENKRTPQALALVIAVLVPVGASGKKIPVRTNTHFW